MHFFVFPSLSWSLNISFVMSFNLRNSELSVRSQIPDYRLEVWDYISFSSVMTRYLSDIYHEMAKNGKFSAFQKLSFRGVE